MELGGATIDVVALSVAVALCVLLVIRAMQRETRPSHLGGLIWMVRWKGFWGPCCEECMNQYVLMPVFNLEGTQYYRLFCPICKLSLEGRIFTLQALLALEREAAAYLRRPRVGAPLHACVISAEHTRLPV